MTDVPGGAGITSSGQSDRPAPQVSQASHMNHEGPAPSVPSLPPVPGESGVQRQVPALLLVAGLVYGLDLASKLLVVAKLSDPDQLPIPLLGGLLTLRLVRNPGAAFGIGVGVTVVFTMVAVLVVAVILRVSRQLYSLPWAVGLGMLLGGALGNLTDRIFRSPSVFSGHVVDFLELPHWPVFNLADSAIVVASGVMVVLSFRGLRLDGTVESAQAATPPPARRGGGGTG